MDAKKYKMTLLIKNVTIKIEWIFGRKRMAYYKVLLADDEKEIRQGIIQKIDWQANGFILAGDAANGREALELAQKIHPDVVMTDIKMPFMSGLELGEILAVEMPLTKLVLFSGFDDFEYAKQAIQINASEYILKPVDSKEVTALLQKLKKQLDHEMKERRDVEILRQNYIQSLPLLRQQFFSSLIEGNFSEKKIQELMKQYHINLKANCWAVTIIKGDNKENGGKGSLSGQAELVPLSLQQIVTENLARLYQTITFLYNDALVVLSLFQKKENILGYVSAINRICDMAGEILELSVTAGIGSVCYQLSHLKYSFKGAINALEYRVLLDDRAIFIDDVEPKGMQLDESEQKILINAIKLDTPAMVEKTVNHMIDYFKEVNTSITQYQIYMTELLSELFKIVKSYQIDLNEIFGTDFKGYFAMQDYESLEELKKWMIEVCVKINMKIKRERLDSAKILTEKAKEFVQKNYGNSDVSVEMLCSYIHVSPAYFSTIFKKETGSSFISYLTNIRMEEAIKLLNTTDDKTYVISAKVGYTEPNYFSYVFKKHFGISPSKYRNSR